MRSFFSTLLLLNWGLLLVLLTLALGVFYIYDLVVPAVRPLILFGFVLITIFGTFYISTNIAMRITDPLATVEKKTKEINAGDFGVELSSPDIRELATLTSSINEMARRLKVQFLDLTVEKEKFNYLLQNLKEGVFAIDRNEKFLFLNRNISDTLIEKNSQFKAYTPAIKNKELLNFIKEKIQKGVEGKTEFQDGLHFYTARIYPIKSDSMIQLFIGVLSDITEDRQNQLIREQFFQNASHELKTPITSIKGYAETLEYKLKLPQDSNERKFLDAILRNTDRLIRIVEDMLTVSRLENHKTVLNLTEFSLFDLVKNVSESLGVIYSQKKQNLVLDIPSDFRVKADRLLLEDLLVNLISNASAYSPEGSSVIVRTSSTEDKNQIQVIDHGIGISAEDAERIFERFFRVDTNRSRKEGGTGLGLSIVKHIARLHSGEVSVTSNPKGGSIFTFEFPKK
ncbi:ATP-binding protein [Leptospira sp. 85282-16]|uniref:histidine kinase n=1 Tax=Leptospira montravelensis TaxID=2484961 RepID=A0ABY2LSX2_9LEPT|nr:MULTISPECIES: HAMP domain-containing sensor histidine kinase [Leptospira]MCT8334429.1 ATP-binding protein [Leptospira sp. 85282-16]TGK80789.1 sensor histidine kinase [Leptospira montravelensis]TGL01620.1 sensor histidine kinase [Leptospira montravelensis]